MKKTIFTLTVLCTMLYANYRVQANDNIRPATCTSYSDDWSKSTNNVWTGDMNGKSYSYKLDKDTKLWWSTDEGKNWSHVATQTWADKSGKWIKISKKNLVWSADMGKTWSTVPDWTWQGADGTWYKFDKDWNIWKK